MKKMAKMKRVILDSVKNHLIPHISRKTMRKGMFDALVTICQIENINRKVLLQNNFRAMQMIKTNIIDDSHLLDEDY
jgi:hypothetical protein